MVTHAPYTFNNEQKEEFLEEVNKNKIEEATSFNTLKDYLDKGGVSEREFGIRRRAYDASIKYLDGLIERLYVKSPKNTVFIFIGDHGELLGEYRKQGINLVCHHFGTFIELIKVPCIIFSKKDLELEIQNNGVFDQRDIIRIIEAVMHTGKVAGKDITFSEYFGRAGFDRQFGNKVPKEYKSLYERKSFSIIDSKLKFDVTSDGNYVWQIGGGRASKKEGVSRFDKFIRNYSRKIKEANNSISV